MKKFCFYCDKKVQFPKRTRYDLRNKTKLIKIKTNTSSFTRYLFCDAFVVPCIRLLL